MGIVNNIRNVITRTAYYQMSTTNQSFLDMHYYLRDKGIKNNKFFLILYDKDLAGVDPYDPNLSPIMKQKVLRECMSNFFYFIREVIRIKDEGGAAGSGKRYKLHRGNLALNFGFMCNWNMFVEFPRQHGKTISAVCYYLWLFNFGTTNSEMMFINKKYDDSKKNLARLKDMRAALPSYLRMSESIGPDGKKIKVPDNTQTVQHPSNFNTIRTLPSAKNATSANGLGRGLTVPIIWYDEFAFIKYNKIIRSAATPAYKRAAMNAANNRKPYGMLLTTTPGIMTDEEGKYAFEVKNNATPFNECYYDFGLEKLEELRKANTKSSLFYIRYTYQQLGSSSEYLEEMIKDMEGDFPSIRREVLLEWAQISENSPFKPEDLEIVKQYIHEPIRTIMLGGLFPMHIYEELSPMAVPIIGVDVSGGYYHDSSAITVIDSKTTKVCACLNCNYISPIQLADVIYELVVNYMPNACVNIERNGGFGASVVARLKNTRIKNNLYFEIKERVIEERNDGIHTNRNKQKVKVYGLDSSKNVRDLLIDILHERMNYHKDKFISPIIMTELNGLEMKKNRVDHSSTTHDDQIFSMLMALYVWYYGKDLMANYGIRTYNIRTDEDYQESMIDNEQSTSYIEIMTDNTENSEEIQEQIDTMQKGHGVLYEEFMLREQQKDSRIVEQMMSNRLFRETFNRTYNRNNISEETGFTTIPDSVFGIEEEESIDYLNREFATMQDIR